MLKNIMTFISLSFVISSTLKGQASSQKIKQTKAYILDMDGVLRRGFTAISGAKEFITWLEKNKKPTLILTNECRYSEKTLRSHLNQMGIKYPHDFPIYTAAMAMRDFFRKRLSLNKKTYCCIIGEEGLFYHMNEIKNKNLIISEDLPSKQNTDYDLYLVFGSVEQIKMKDLETARRWIKAGAKTLISSPDSSDPSSKGDQLIGMPGHMVHMLKQQAPTKAYNTGKPNPMVIEKAIALLRKKSPLLKRKEIMFVGDSYDTDMKIAFEAKMHTTLVLSGNTHKEMIRKEVIPIDSSFQSVKELLKVLSS